MATYVLRAKPPRAAVRCVDDYGDALVVPTVIDDGVDSEDTGLLNKDGVKIHRLRERTFGFQAPPRKTA